MASQLPLGPDGQPPYGLALELLSGQNGNPESFLNPDTTITEDERAMRAGLVAPTVARLGNPTGGVGPSDGGYLPPSQPPLDPFTVMELAANQQGLPEPDYGFVAELRNRAPPDPFAADYGLAAEVARRCAANQRSAPSAPYHARLRRAPPPGTTLAPPHHPMAATASAGVKYSVLVHAACSRSGARSWEVPP